MFAKKTKVPAEKSAFEIKRALKLSNSSQDLFLYSVSETTESSRLSTTEEPFSIGLVQT